MLPLTGAVRVLILPALRRGPLKLLLYRRPIISRCSSLSYGTTRRTLITPSGNSLTSYNDPHEARRYMRRIPVEANFILKDYNLSRALESVRQLQKMGYRDVPAVIDHVCRSLIEEDRLNDAVTLTKEIILIGILERGEIQQQTYNQLLKGFAELREMTGDTSIAAQFADFVNFMDENDYELDASGYIYVMRMASLVGNSELALECFRQLQDVEDYEVTAQGYLLRAYLNKARRTNNYDGIAALIGWCHTKREHYTRSVVDILTTELIEDNQLDLAVTIVKDLIGRYGVQINQHTFTRLLKGFVDLRVISDDSGIAKSFSQFVHYVVGHGYNVDDFDQFQMLRMAALEGSCELAQECFDGLKVSKEFADPTALYWLLVQAHISAMEKNKDDNCESVFNCFEEMLNDGSADISTDPINLFKVLQLSSWYGRSKLALACIKGLRDNVHHDDAECHLNAISSEMGLLLLSFINEARIANSYDNHADVIQYFDFMVSKGLKINPSTIKAYIEHLVVSNASEEAREALQKLNMSADSYLDYLEDLLQIKRHLVCCEEEEALKIARESHYYIDCENFIVSYRHSVRTAARFGTGLEEKGRIMENFDQDHAIGRLSILAISGYRKVGLVLNDVVRDLINTQRFDYALNLTKGVIEKGVMQVRGLTYVELLKGFADHVKVNKGTGAESFYKFIDLMDNEGYIADHWVQVEKLRIAAILGDGELAQACFDMLKGSNEFKICDRHYLMLLGALMNESRKHRSDKNMGKVLSHFNVMCNYDNEIVFEDSDLIEVLKIASAMGDSETAQLAFDKAEVGRMNGVHHGLLLQSYVNQSTKTGKYGNGEVVLQIFNEALEKNLEMIGLTIKMFITNSIRSGLSKDALAAIQKLTKDKDRYLDYYFERLSQEDVSN